MSGFDVEPEDMRRAMVLDKKLDALLGGREPAPGDEMGAELALMLQELESAFPAAVVSEQVEDLHIARIVETAAESVVPANAPVAPVRSSFLDRMRAGASRRVAAASLAFTTAFGGAAYAGVLPAPVQRAVANAAGAVGLELPNPAGRDGKGSVAGDDQDRDDRETAEVTDGRADPEYRHGADGVTDADGRDDNRGRGEDAGRASGGGDSDDARDERDDDDSDDRDDADADDDGENRSGRGGAGREADDDDDVEYEAPDESRDSDRDDDITEPEDDEESSFDERADREADDGDELDVEADDLEEASDE